MCRNVPEWWVRGAAEKLKTSISLAPTECFVVVVAPHVRNSGREKKNPEII
jgi:hypothetical protein